MWGGRRRGFARAFVHVRRVRCGTDPVVDCGLPAAHHEVQRDVLDDQLEEERGVLSIWYIRI